MAIAVAVGGYVVFDCARDLRGCTLVAVRSDSCKQDAQQDLANSPYERRYVSLRLTASNHEDVGGQTCADFGHRLHFSYRWRLQR
jgi:hypothetical protein